MQALPVIILLFFSQLHPLYLSNTAVRYQPENERIYLRFQIFEEDLDAILTIGYNTGINDTQNPNLAKYINEYLFDNFKLIMDGKLQTNYQFISRAKQYDSIILEYELRGIKSAPQKMEVEITFLLEMFPEQTNIVSFTVGKQKKSFPLKEFNTKATFTVN
jgi:hypothetical protein